MLSKDDIELESKFLTQLFCVVLQKIRTVSDSPFISFYFLVKDNKQVTKYKNNYQKLVDSTTKVYLLYLLLLFTVYTNQKRIDCCYRDEEGDEGCFPLHHRITEWHF